MYIGNNVYTSCKTRVFCKEDEIHLPTYTCTRMLCMYECTIFGFLPTIWDDNITVECRYEYTL